jgi:hypothetical protein
MPRSELQFRATALFSLVGAMWFVRLLYFIMPGGFGLYGIIPRTWDGLPGIITRRSSITRSTT